jgi:hypothetical protein
MAASHEIVQRYIDSVNESNATAGASCRTTLTSDSTYIDPHADLRGT